MTSSACALTASNGLDTSRLSGSRLGKTLVGSVANTPIRLPGLAPASPLPLTLTDLVAMSLEPPKALPKLSPIFWTLFCTPPTIDPAALATLPAVFWASPIVPATVLLMPVTALLASPITPLTASFAPPTTPMAVSFTPVMVPMAVSLIPVKVLPRFPIWLKVVPAVFTTPFTALLALLTPLPTLRMAFVTLFFFAATASCRARSFSERLLRLIACTP